MPKLFEVFWVFQMYVCASMQKGPQRDLLTTKSLLPSQRNLEIKKHGMGISHKSIFLNACPMQFEQFDVLTKAF